MVLYLSAKTSVPDLCIDYIEIELTNGETVSLNWDESEISRESWGFEARYKGVCFGEKYANGKLNQLKGMKVLEVGVYSESAQDIDLNVTYMDFYDENKHEKFTFENHELEWIRTD